MNRFLIFVFTFNYHPKEFGGYLKKTILSTYSKNLNFLTRFKAQALKQEHPKAGALGCYPKYGKL